jgi:hypothetical protein
VARRRCSARLMAEPLTVPACIRQGEVNDSTGGTRRQLVERTVEGQMVNFLRGSGKVKIRTLQSRSMRHPADAFIDGMTVRGRYVGPKGLTP